MELQSSDQRSFIDFVRRYPKNCGRRQHQRRGFQSRRRTRCATI